MKQMQVKFSMHVLKCLAILHVAFFPPISCSALDAVVTVVSCGVKRGAQNFLQAVSSRVGLGQQKQAEEIQLPNLAQLNVETSRFIPNYIEEVSNLTREFLRGYCDTDSYTQSDCLLNPKMPPIKAKARYTIFLFVLNKTSLGCTFCIKDQPICDSIHLSVPFQAIDLLYESGSNFVEKISDQVSYLVKYIIGYMILSLAGLVLICLLQICIICRTRCARWGRNIASCMTGSNEGSERNPNGESILL